MANLAEVSDLPVALTEFRETLGALGLPQHHVARLFTVTPRAVRRWQRGDRHIPCGVSIVLRLLATGAVTIDQIEQAAAVAIPAQTNGGAELEPPALRLSAPAPEMSVVADAEIATFADPAFADLTSADPGPTIAEKICALAPEACRWPCGDPGHPDFYFCSGLVAQRPYCGRHRALAYVTPAARRFSRSSSSKPTNSRSLRQRF
jgi:hypothetical protein